MAHSIDVSEESGIRYLHFGSEWVQGAMKVRRPYALELEYTRHMAAGLLLRPAPRPRKVLLIGLGAASLTKFFYRNVPQARITVAEIDARVVAVARMHFKLPDEDARLRIVVADGAEVVMRNTGYWDMILVDGYDHNARAGVLDTAPFYTAARAALATNGLLASNLFGKRKTFRDSLARIADAFDGRTLALPQCETGNVVALANAGDAFALPFADIQARAAALKLETGLDLRDTFKRLEAEQPTPDGVLRF